MVFPVRVLTKICNGKCASNQFQRRPQGRRGYAGYAKIHAVWTKMRARQKHALMPAMAPPALHRPPQALPAANTMSGARVHARIGKRGGLQASLPVHWAAGSKRRAASRGEAACNARRARNLAALFNDHIRITYTRCSACACAGPRPMEEQRETVARGPTRSTAPPPAQNFLPTSTNLKSGLVGGVPSRGACRGGGAGGAWERRGGGTRLHLRRCRF